MSDHECLSLLLKTEGLVATPYLEPCITKKRPFKFAYAQEFLMKLNSPLSKENLNNFVSLYSNASDSSIESMASDLIDVVNKASHICHSPSTKRKKNRRKSDKKMPVWYSSECKKLKWSLNMAEKQYRKDPFNLGKKENLFVARKRFKSCCKTNERFFREKLPSQLLDTEKESPVEFWKMVKKCKNGVKMPQTLANPSTLLNG